MPFKSPAIAGGCNALDQCRIVTWAAAKLVDAMAQHLMSHIQATSYGFWSPVKFMLVGLPGVAEACVSGYPQNVMCNASPGPRRRDSLPACGPVAAKGVTLLITVIYATVEHYCCAVAEDKYKPL